MVTQCWSNSSPVPYLPQMTTRHSDLPPARVLLGQINKNFPHLYGLLLVIFHWPMFTSQSAPWQNPHLFGLYLGLSSVLYWGLLSVVASVSDWSSGLVCRTKGSLQLYRPEPRAPVKANNQPARRNKEGEAGKDWILSISVSLARCGNR